MKTILRIAILIVPLYLAGCTSWWTQFSSNPAAYVASFEAGVQVFLTTSDAVVSAILPTLGNKAPALESAYEDAKIAVGHTESALNDALQAAIDAQVTSPDLTKVIGDVLGACDEVVSAVTAIQNAISVAQSTSSVASASSTGFIDLKSERQSLEHYRR